MTEVYQPVIVLYLLEQDGAATKAELAGVLSGYDEAVQEYYERIVMRWPKITLTKHDVVTYERKQKRFYLNFKLDDPVLVNKAKKICEEKIRDWIEKRAGKSSQGRLDASKRYRVLKAAKGKCELCGISAKISPIDVDHIVPRAKADKRGYVVKDGVRMHIDDERNLQALCFRCNRAKRDTDATDFRLPDKKLVRDRIPEIINKSGRTAIVKQLGKKQLKSQLLEKLTEEHSELLAKTNLEEIVDMVEVLLSLGKQLGFSEDEIVDALHQKRQERGAFDQGLFLVDILSADHGS
jgi:predicted house-cleaning noncanonical NTP pyrophosphatase (MazG superfamily)